MSQLPIFNALDCNYDCEFKHLHFMCIGQEQYNEGTLMSNCSALQYGSSELL
jgi:hypothetical protein